MGLPALSPIKKINGRNWAGSLQICYKLGRLSLCGPLDLGRSSPRVCAFALFLTGAGRSLTIDITNVVVAVAVVVVAVVVTLVVFVNTALKFLLLRTYCHINIDFRHLIFRS